MSGRIATDALLVRRVERGDADLVLTFFTERHGTVSAIAYAARRSKRRFAVLEPFHTLRIEADDITGRELAVLQSATMPVPRRGFLTNLDRMSAASKAIGWVRRVSPPRAPDAQLWTATTVFLDTATACEATDLPSELAAFGLTMLGIVGWLPPPESVRAGMCPKLALRVVDDTLREFAGADTDSRR